MGAYISLVQELLNLAVWEDILLQIATPPSPRGADVDKYQFVFLLRSAECIVHVRGPFRAFVLLGNQKVVCARFRRGHRHRVRQEAE